MKSLTCRLVTATFFSVIASLPSVIRTSAGFVELCAAWADSQPLILSAPTSENSRRSMRSWPGVGRGWVDGPEGSPGSAGGQAPDDAGTGGSCPGGAGYGCAAAYRAFRPGMTSRAMRSNTGRCSSRGGIVEADLRDAEGDHALDHVGEGLLRGVVVDQAAAGPRPGVEHEIGPPERGGITADRAGTPRRSAGFGRASRPAAPGSPEGSSGCSRYPRTGPRTSA